VLLPVDKYYYLSQTQTPLFSVKVLKQELQMLSTVHFVQLLLHGIMTFLPLLKNPIGGA
jgi:hypothetical protein